MEVKRTLKSNATNDTFFDQLLNWLAESRVESVEMYQFIHNKLIMYFAARGCAEAEDLADKTIDRVAQKIISNDIQYVGNKMKYFYSFAKNIYLEYLNKRNLQLNDDILSDDTFEEEEDLDKEVSNVKLKLRQCLSTLKRKDRNLLLKYYGVESGREKQFREKIAKKYKIPSNSLRVKIFRLKKILTECIENHAKD